MSLSLEQHQELTEFLTDMEVHAHRLNEWEINFINNMRSKFQKYGADSLMSEKQWEAVRRIQNKIYQTG